MERTRETETQGERKGKEDDKVDDKYKHKESFWKSCWKTKSENKYVGKPSQTSRILSAMGKKESKVCTRWERRKSIEEEWEKRVRGRSAREMEVIIKRNDEEQEMKTKLPLRENFNYNN